jgi:hypothetical protein
MLWQSFLRQSSQLSCLSAINDATVNTYMQLYKQQNIGVRFFFGCQVQKLLTSILLMVFDSNDSNQWVHQPISPCVVHISMKFWLIDVYHVSVRLFIVGVCSCCVQYCLVSSIPWLITKNNNNDGNQTMDSEANITLWNASIDTVLVDCCC